MGWREVIVFKKKNNNFQAKVDLIRPKQAEKAADKEITQKPNFWK
jgi:hypothetical protein